MASSRVVLPAPVGPVMANRPLPAKGSAAKSIFHSPLSELRFLRRRLRIFMHRSKAVEGGHSGISAPRDGSVAAIALATAPGEAVALVGQPFHTGGLAVAGAQHLHHAVTDEDDLRPPRPADDTTRPGKIGDGQAAIGRRAGDLRSGAFTLVPAAEALFGLRRVWRRGAAAASQYGRRDQRHGEIAHGSLHDRLLDVRQCSFTGLAASQPPSSIPPGL